jgi:hypothetical protein
MHALASRWLRHPHAFVVTIAIAMALALSTLGIGFFADDYAFVASLDGASPQKLNPFALYDFAGGDASAVRELIQRGPLPWWTAPDLKVRFFRPLSSALFSLDHALFGHHPLAYHVQGLVWFLAVLVGVGLIYRRVLSKEMAAWSFLPFAVGAHFAESVGWISSRHLLVAGAPALLGLAAHVHYREGRWAPGRWLSVAGILLGLLGGEAALGAALYWIAYEMVGAPDAAPRLRRARNASVPIAIVSLYLVAYKIFNFGAAHTNGYVEPLSSPLRFAGVAFERGPILLGHLFAEIPAGLAVVLAPTPLAMAGALATAGVAVLLAMSWSLVSPADRRALRWLVLGCVLSLLACLGALPGSRLLLMPSVGAYAVLGVVLGHGGRALARSSSRLALIGRRAGFILLFFIHVIASPLLFVASAQLMRHIGAGTLAIAASLDEIAARSKKPSLFVIASDPMAGFYAGAASAVRAPGSFSAWCILSMARGTHRLRRVDARTLAITIEPGMLHGGFETVFRGDDRPLAVGDEVELEAARIKVIAAQGGHPTAIEVAFKAPSIEDPGLQIVAWIDGRLQAVRLPEVGGVLEIPWSPGPMGIL